MNTVQPRPLPFDMEANQGLHKYSTEKARKTNLRCQAISSAPVQQVASEYKPFHLSSQNIPAGLSSF